MLLPFVQLVHVAPLRPWTLTPWLEDCVHYHLEHCRGVGKSKEHDSWFKQPFRSEEGCLPFISWFDPDVVVSPVNINLGE